MLPIEEKILQAQKTSEQRKRLQKVKERQEREAKKKINQRRCFAIGELVVKHFPEVMKFEPGTIAENKVTFQPLDAFLTILAADTELLKNLKQRAKLTELQSEHVSGLSNKVGELDG